MKKIIRDMFFLLFGTFLLAFSVGFFLIPYDILSGGVAGIAIVLKAFVPLPAELLANGLVIGLFFIGWIFLGNKFAVKTVVSSFAYPIFLTATVLLVEPPVIDPILASLYGGLLAGAGVGCVIRTGASTGGMDIPPLVIHKYTKISVVVLILVVDFATVLLGIWVYSLESVLIGFFSVFASSFAIDRMLLLGGVKSKSIQIISDKYQEISIRIHIELERGTTLLTAQGGYTQEDKKVILVVVDQKEYNQIIELVNQVDEKAFLLAVDATDVHGEGFNVGYRV